MKEQKPLKKDVQKKSEIFFSTSERPGTLIIVE